MSANLTSVVDSAVRELLTVTHRPNESYVHLPLITPSGASVTVRISRRIGGFNVDDAGFTYSDLESVGAERSFAKTAAKLAEAEGLIVGKRMISAIAEDDDLGRAICDVGVASWSVVDRVYGKLHPADDYELSDALRARLAEIFGTDHVDENQIITGSSTNEWEVSAILHLNGKRTVFQAIGENVVSVYKASTAFHDIGANLNPPVLVAVVRDLSKLGPRLNILSQSGGRVIQSDQPNEVYKRAVGD